MSLQQIVANHIRHNGPMDVGTFMSMALGHPQYGYYMKKDPLGTEGDFTTAPEISQMFGEMIGAWCADCWMRLGAPISFHFAECGPGRGTLMADMLRATKRAAGFHDSMDLNLIETSPSLKMKQKQALDGYNVKFHNRLDTVSSDRPLILVANEFLDALPVRQFQKTDDGWRERVIGLDGDSLVFGLGGAAPDIEGAFPKDAAAGDIFEVAPARESFIADVLGHMRMAGGIALFIDYGHGESAAGDTLQAVKNHEYVDVLKDIGDADLTSHVDFGALARIAVKTAGQIWGPVTQGDFLRKLGIGMRCEMLKGHADDKQKDELDAALQRLTADDQMGKLFKVMAFSYGLERGPEGF